ncbi:MAG: polyprenyl synthetase family protein [Anaerolineales bacterium]|nr:MAG: polyprenyl synthetase family protein [Anaerolineales bacterium]
MSLQDIFDRYLPAIEEELRQVLSIPDQRLDPFYGMMHYHLGWTDESFKATRSQTGGKRLRPLFCLLACQAVGGEPQQALPAAAAVELIHNFSLLHDDIEDNSPTRRHRTTVWKIWGEPQAINAGDGMFALAHLALQRLSEKDLPDDRVLAACWVFDQTCLALCEGQYLDMSFEDRLDVDVDRYLAMIRRKTAALLSCSTHLGALLGSGDAGLATRYARFGENLGLAFQIEDDILGIWGEEKVTGKPQAGDIRQRKKSLPIVYALQQEASLPVFEQRVREVYRRKVIDEDAIEVVLGSLQTLGARQYAQQMALDYYGRALAELEAAGMENEGQDGLQDLATLLVNRKY